MISLIIVLAFVALVFIYGIATTRRVGRKVAVKSFDEVAAPKPVVKVAIATKKADPKKKTAAKKTTK